MAADNGAPAALENTQTGELIDKMDAAAQEGARAFAEKRKPDWKC